MITSWQPALGALFRVEGGFSNNPGDPGGMTNLGVTARQWAAFTGKPLSAITEAQMRALTMAMVGPFYRNNYWNLVDGDMLPVGLDAMVFHFEVNAGGQSARLLQKLVGVPTDGLIGPKTLGACQGFLANYGIDNLLEQLASAQLEYYQALPGFATFGRGWTARVEDFLALAQNLAA